MTQRTLNLLIRREDASKGRTSSQSLERLPKAEAADKEDRKTQGKLEVRH